MYRVSLNRKQFVVYFTAFPLLGRVRRIEYTQSGNGHFLAYIPSWWWNQPSLVRMEGARPPLFTKSTITYKVVVVYAPAERGRYTPLISPLPLYVLYSVICLEDIPLYYRSCTTMYSIYSYWKHPFPKYSIFLYWDNMSHTYIFFADISRPCAALLSTAPLRHVCSVSLFTGNSALCCIVHPFSLMWTLCQMTHFLF
jgi:hypothetical protein